MRSWLPRLSRSKKNLVDVDGVGGVDSEKNGHGVEEGDDNDLHVVVRLEGEGGARDMAIMMIVIVGGVTNNHDDRVEEHDDHDHQVVARLEGEDGDGNDLYVVARLEGEGGALDMTIMMIVMMIADCWWRPK